MPRRTGKRAILGVDARTREGRLLKAMRADLIAHLGGAPSATQTVLVDRAIELSRALLRMDAQQVADGQLSDHSAKAYLGWSNSLSRIMKALGLQARASRRESAQDVIARRIAERRAA